MASVKILVVEDEVIVAKDIQDMLKSRGYDVPAIALSGEQAIEKTEQIQPDLVLMDIVLKGDVDGIEAAEQIRRRFAIPVLYLTAYTDEQTVKRARITEPFGYITKPFNKRELYTNIEMALYKHKAEKALRRSKQEWEETFNAISDWVVLIDLKGRILRTNHAGEEFVGVPLAGIVGQTCCKLLHGSDTPLPGCPLLKMLQTGQNETMELQLPDSNRWFAITVDPVRDEKGTLVGAVHVTRDITGRKLFETEQEITIELLHFLNAKNQKHELMELVTKFLKDWSGCEAIGIRLQEGEDFPYYVTSSLPEEFILAETKLCAVNELGEIERDSQGKPHLECMCGNVISGRFDPSKPFFTEHGSFWINSTTELLATTTNTDLMARIRNRCNTAGYESVALIPLRVGRETFGLLQFNDKHKGRFTPKKISMFERMADSLAIGLAQRQAEEALRESEEHYRMLAETMNDGLGVIDEKGTYVYVNNKFGEILGHSPDEMVGRSWKDFFDEDAQKIINEQLIERKKGVAKPYELINTRKDGQKIFLRRSPQAIFDENGKFKGSFAITTDITERKKAEQNVQEAEAELKHTIEVVPCIIAKANAHTGYFTHCNPALSSILGFSSEEFLARPFMEFVHPDDRQSTINEVEKQLKGSPVAKFENRYICKDGSYKWLEWRATATDEKGVVYAAATDITERKKAELELKLHSEIMTNMSEGVYLVGADDGIIAYTNPKFEEIFGYDKGEMIGKHVSIVNAPTDKHPEETAREIIESMNKEGAWEGEIENIKKDGTRFWCFATVTMFHHPEYGRVLVAVHTDITERKRAEEQIAKLAKFPAENPNPVLRISGHGTVVYVNKAGSPLLKSWRCRVGESLPEPWHEFVMDALSSGQSQQTEVKCDGRIFSLTFAPVVDANYVNVYGHDITGRKRVEDKLRESEERFRQFFENEPEYCYMISPEAVILDVNKAALDVLGYEKSRLVGQPLEVIYAPESQPKMKQLVKKWKKTGTLRNEEIVLVTKKGDRRIVLLSADVVRDKDGKVLHSVSVQRDITERKKTEDKLLEDQAKLKAMASEMLRTEERERQRLAVGLHDSVCQKLVLTKLALESSLNLVSDSNLLASLRIVCEGIGETIEQADSLTFELSNPVLRQLGFVIALEKYLTEEIRQKHGIAFELESDEQLGAMQDEIKNCLFRVTRELLTNVVKHAHAHKIRVSVRESQSQIYVRVQDDGVGFKESQAGSKVSQTARFGLFSIREQLEYLGGHLEIESEPGRGTKATVVVPLTKNAIV